MSRSWGVPRCVGLMDAARAERRRTLGQDAKHDWSDLVLGILTVFLIIAAVFFVGVAAAVKLGVLGL